MEGVSDWGFHRIGLKIILFCNDGFWSLTDLFWGIEMGESIHSHIFGTWTIGDCEIEVGEKQRPPGMSGIFLHHVDIADSYGL